MLTEPVIEFTKAHAPGFVEVQQECEGGGVCKLQPVSIDSQERGRDCDGNALVAVDERVILRQTFPQGGALFDKVPIVSDLRTGQRRFQRAYVPDTVRAAKSLNQHPVNYKDFGR